MATTALCQTAGFAVKVPAVRNASFVRVRTASWQGLLRVGARRSLIPIADLERGVSPARVLMADWATAAPCQRLLSQQPIEEPLC
jgi:hypothetical protein